MSYTKVPIKTKKRGVGGKKQNAVVNEPKP